MEVYGKKEKRGRRNMKKWGEIKKKKKKGKTGIIQIKRGF